MPEEKRILIAGDNKQTIKKTADFLKGIFKDVSITIAYNGRDAFNELLRHNEKGEPFDLLILDDLMPSEDYLRSKNKEKAKDREKTGKEIIGLVSAGRFTSMNNVGIALISGDINTPVGVRNGNIMSFSPSVFHSLSTRDNSLIAFINDIFYDTRSVSDTQNHENEHPTSSLFDEEIRKRNLWKLQMDNKRNAREGAGIGARAWPEDGEYLRRLKNAEAAKRAPSGDTGLIR